MTEVGNHTWSQGARGRAEGVELPWATKLTLLDASSHPRTET